MDGWTEEDSQILEDWISPHRMVRCVAYSKFALVLKEIKQNYPSQLQMSDEGLVLKEMSSLLLLKFHYAAARCQTVAESLFGLFCLLLCARPNQDSNGGFNSPALCLALVWSSIQSSIGRRRHRSFHAGTCPKNRSRKSLLLVLGLRHFSSILPIIGPSVTQNVCRSFFSKPATKKTVEKKSAKDDSEENPAKTKTCQDTSSATLT